MFLLALTQNFFQFILPQVRRHAPTRRAARAVVDLVRRPEEQALVALHLGLRLVEAYVVLHRRYAGNILYLT